MKQDKDQIVQILEKYPRLRHLSLNFSKLLLIDEVFKKKFSGYMISEEEFVDIQKTNPYISALSLKLERL